MCILGPLTFFRAKNSFSAVALKATSSSYLGTKRAQVSVARVSIGWDLKRSKEKEGSDCRRRNETPTLQSGLNLYILTLASYSCFILYPLHNNLQGKLPSTTIQRLYSAQAQGKITFTLAYLLQLRLCFGELSYQLRIRFVPGSVPFEESEKHPCVQAMFFSHGNKQDS